jgi:hypothetical protein
LSEKLATNNTTKEGENGMQTTAMNSVFMPAGRSEAKATGKAGSDPFFGAVLSGRQAAPDNVRQLFSVGSVKATLPADKRTEDISFSGLQALSGMSLDDLSQLQIGGAKLDPAVLKQLQALLTKLTAQLNQAGLDGESLLAKLDFSAVAQGLGQFSGSPEDGRQLLEQLQQHLASKLGQLGWPAIGKRDERTGQQQDGLVLPEPLMERLEPEDLAALQKQIASILEGEDPVTLKGRLRGLQEQLEAGVADEQGININGRGGLSALLEQIGSVLEGEDPATLKDQLRGLQEQLEAGVADEQGINIGERGGLSALLEQIGSVLDSEEPATLKSQLRGLQAELQGLNKPLQVMPQEELTQLRKQLQQQINGVAQQLQQTAEAAGQVREHSSRPNREELDPRFANLIRPQDERDSQKEFSLGQQKTAGEQEKLALSELQMAGHANKAVASLLNQVRAKQHQFQQGNIVPQVQGQGSPPQVATPTPVMPMATGQAVPDSQIFDQVVTRMAGSFNGESGRMILRLHPAELGSLKLDLQVEGQTIRANLQAQSSQVQEILERNLPQLRQALVEQGLKIDQFQVNLEQRQQSEQFEDLQRHWGGGEDQVAEPLELGEEEEQVIPLAHLLQNGGAGISLHV